MADGGEVLFGQRLFLHCAIDAYVDGFGFGEKLLAVAENADETIAEFDDVGAQSGYTGFNDDFIVVAGGRAVAAACLDYGKMTVVGQLHLLVVVAKLAKELDAPDFAPDKIIGVVDDAHLVGFGVADAELCLGRLRHCSATSPGCTALISVKRAKSFVLKVRILSRPWTRMAATKRVSCTCTPDTPRSISNLRHSSCTGRLSGRSRRRDSKSLALRSASAGDNPKPFRAAGRVEAFRNSARF